MRKLITLFIFLLLVGGCSNEEQINQITMKYENLIEEQQKEIQEQQEEIEKLNQLLEESKLVPDGDYRSSLQEVDRESRLIMRLISEGDFEQLKKDYSVEFEVEDDIVVFSEPESNSPFPIEWASNFMYICNFIKDTDGMQVSYFISNPKNERSELISLRFDNDLKLKYIFVGDA